MAYGQFRDGGKAFEIHQPKLPRHWYNYLWNDRYLAFTSQVGAGEGFAQDDLGRRIELVASRQVYVLEEGCPWFFAGGWPTQPVEAFKATHGLGTTTIQVQQGGIVAAWRLFVPADLCGEIWSVTLRNTSLRPRQLKVIPYFSTGIDGVYKPQGYNTDKGGFARDCNAVIGVTYPVFAHDKPAAMYSYLLSSQPATGYDARKNAFIGVYGNEQAPQALAQGGCTGSECLGEKIIFALENTLVLQPGEEQTLHYVMGCDKSREAIGDIGREYTCARIEQEHRKVTARFLEQIQGVELQTPDAELNALFHWLKHAANLGSRWARVRHNGYRDMTSDSECLASVNPELAWERLKRVLSYQYRNGYAPRTFIGGEIRDNKFADNTVWITMALHAVLMETGRLELLEEQVPFNDAGPAPVYEHMKRSVDFLWNFRGQHDLVRIWGGDWNDCMNAAGLQGRGVSVWLSIAWYRANALFGQIAELAGRADDAAESRRRGALMRDLIDAHGWDGEYYLTAISDEGIKIGSHENEEGKMYLIPQLWAVLARVARDGKDQIAMESVERYLETELGTVVSWPGYTKYLSHVGSMCRKPAGVHENGGVYLHTLAWKLAVDALRRRNDLVARGLEKMLPGGKGIEPYAMCNSYFGIETGYRRGTPGQSWRTAAGPWLMKALVNYVCGVQPEMRGLRLAPCLPGNWGQVCVRKVFRGSRYEIHYQGQGNVMKQVRVNGEAWNQELLPWEQGKSYLVEVALGLEGNG